MDHAFASLLQGEDVDTREILPGFERGMKGGMSRTDMVRCRSLVEATRVQIVEIMSKEGEADTQSHWGTDVDTENETNADTRSVGAESSACEEEEEDRLNMDVARVYEKTIVQLDVALRNSTRYDTGFEQENNTG